MSIYLSVNESIARFGEELREEWPDKVTPEEGSHDAAQEDWALEVKPKEGPHDMKPGEGLRQIVPQTRRADEVPHSTRDKDNFQRMARLLLSVGTTLLREFFDSKCPPSNLPRILIKNPSTVKKLMAAKLTKPQWDCLYPSPGVYGESKDFDVTLLFELLWTICNLTPPRWDWDNLPPSADHSLEQDLARIKYYYNAVHGHNQNKGLKDEEFLYYWEEISNSLIRIAGSISPQKERERQTTIENFLIEPLTAEHERDVEELQRLYKEDTEVKEFIEKSTSRTLQNIAEGLEEHTIMVKEGLEKCLVCSETTCSQDDHKGVGKCYNDSSGVKVVLLMITTSEK